MLDIVPYEVGKFYDVPCVRARIGAVNKIWPVLGPWHEDQEIIGFTYYHFHLDLRFLTDDDLRYVSGCSAGYPEYVAVHNHDRRFHRQFGIKGRFWRPTYAVKPLGLRRRRCLREMPEYSRSAVWIKELERAFRNARVDPKQLVCPHRGAPLQGLTPDENQNVTCPLHGLCWSLKTGRLVESAELKQESSNA